VRHAFSFTGQFAREDIVRVGGVCKRTGRNKSDIVKESISLYLWEVQFRETRKSLSLKGKKAGIVTEEDVFKVVS
jgi:hypothetical protein